MKTQKNPGSSRYLPNLPALRLWIQSAYLLFVLWMGYRFFLFYGWATGKSEEFVARPPSVEGFLPISGLLGLKRLLLSATWDPVHPAGLVILLTAMAIAILLRKGFCGWICPVGAVSNLVERGSRKLKLRMRLPVWLDLPLLSLKYFLLVFFLYAIFWKMNLAQVIAFQKTPYNIAADAKMLHFFTDPSRLTLQIMAFLVVVSIFVRNFWCRYLCPYGALLGLLAMIGPTQIHRDAAKCVDCKKCEKACSGLIRITDKETVRNAECIGCLECVSVCPQKDCLTVRATFLGRLRPIVIPALVVGFFLTAWAAANLTGHWQSQVPIDTMRQAYRASERLAHPPM